LKESFKKQTFNLEIITFHDIVDVVLEEIGAHRIIKVAGRVTPPVLRDDNVGITVVGLDPVKHPPNPPRRDSQKI